MREKVDPGNWELHLSSSAGTVKLIDDSGATTDPTVSQGGRVFNVVSGSIASGTAVTDTAAASETTDGAYGLFYPDMGIMILNGQKLDQGYLALATNTASNVAHNNTGKLYNSVSASSGDKVHKIAICNESGTRCSKISSGYSLKVSDN